MRMSELINKGKVEFNLSVPYYLYETGYDDKKPLIIYLHGYKQNAHYFEKKLSTLKKFEAYHLFMQGPYPVYDENRKRKVEEWGRAWYLYDGRQEQFLQSMEKSAGFIDKVLQTTEKEIEISRRSIMGYSMGGYLASYYALSRFQQIDDLIVAGARVKIEHFVNKDFSGLNVLAIHGKNDKSVKAEPQQRSCKKLRAQGAIVDYKPIDAGHRLSDEYVINIKQWLMNKEFKIHA